MYFDDVLTKCLLGDEQLATLGARHVTDVAMHLDVVVVATALVRHEAAAVALQHRHLTVHEHLMTTEQVRCNHTQHDTVINYYYYYYYYYYYFITGISLSIST